MSARRLADETEWGKRRERHMQQQRDEHASTTTPEPERRDEPPPPKGAVDHWYDYATDKHVAVLPSGEMRSFIAGAGGGWIGGVGQVARGVAVERLAAALAQRDRELVEAMKLLREAQRHVAVDPSLRSWVGAEMDRRINEVSAAYDARRAPAPAAPAKDSKPTD